MPRQPAQLRIWAVPCHRFCSPTAATHHASRATGRSRFDRSCTALAFSLPMLTLEILLQESSFRATRSVHNLSSASEAELRRPPSRNSNAAESPRPGSRESSKENMAPPDADEYEKYRKEIESLKAEIGTLQYRMQTAEQEKEIALSHQNNRIEQARRLQEDELRRRQAAEESQKKASQLSEILRGELEELKETAAKDKAILERKTREIQEVARLLEEQLEDASIAKGEAERLASKRIADLEAHMFSMRTSMHELEQESQLREATLQQKQASIAEKDDCIATLEADVLRLKAQAGDSETMHLIKTELSEQVHHVRTLEATNRDQLAELKHLRAVNRATEVVEEEKRSLQRKLEATQTLEAELAEAKRQRQRLEDERLAWTAYLNNSNDAAAQEFDSPEAMARALAQERLTTASYVEQLGTIQAEMTAQQSNIRSLEDEKSNRKMQVDQAKVAGDFFAVDKARLRLDRQRALAIKEVEFLRAQLKTFDTEEQSMQHEQYDDARAVRIRELEELVDGYKEEVQILHKELSSKEPSSADTPSQSAVGIKRTRSEDDGHEQLGQLSRKNRKLQEGVAELQTQVALLERDLSAAREQLAAAKERGQTRVLSLRSNPTSDHEAIKRSTLEALQRENKDLLATLRSKNGDSTIPLVPTSVLAAMEREIAAAKAETASSQKSARRLKEVWASKSQEFKEAIFSTLGWTVTFIPNGKMRVESTFFPSQTDEHENSIVFDGERGTMKVGGGPKSPFARRISDQIGFWVREKGCIPGFLAALTLEFYEDHTRVSKA